MKMLSWVLHEVKLQMINGLYGVYIVANLIYIFLMGYIPDKYIDIASTLIIFSDPTMLGMIFVGAFVLLEKRSGIIKSLGITPLGASGYIFGKVISMLIIGICTAIVIGITYRELDFNFIVLIITVAMSSAIFTMIGIIISSYTSSMNQYLCIVVIGMTILSVPLINFIGFDFKVLNIIPTYSVVILIWQSITNVDIGVMNIIVLLIWLGLLMKITCRVVDNKLFK